MCLHRSLAAVVFMAYCLLSSNLSCAKPVFNDESFTKDDAVLVVDRSGKVIFDWQINKAMLPASLIKLATAQLAIEKWGLEHQFYTDFYRVGNSLWIKGYGDPYLVSEELDLLVAGLRERINSAGFFESVNIDSSYFVIEDVPGRSKVIDPYNAPLSAVSANFNTAQLRTVNGVIHTGEPQTPLTNTALEVGKSTGVKAIAGAERINLLSAFNARKNFAELLILKLGVKSDVVLNVDSSNTLPDGAEHIYRHTNSHDVRSILQGTLEFSNNFMANQLFLKLADTSDERAVSFDSAAKFANAELARRFNWKDHKVIEGSGLSRANRLSAKQLDDLLLALEPNKQVFKEVENRHAKVRAKTGTLDGVRSFAGYITLPKEDYRFIFIFNRSVPWRYREQLLQRLIDQLRPG